MGAAGRIRVSGPREFPFDNARPIFHAGFGPAFAVSPPPAISESPAGPTQVRWFNEEVQPHEASLRAYLRGSFPAMRDVDDLVQDSFVRVWKARATQPIRSAKAFLFTVARRLALDRVRRERISPIAAVGHLGELRVLEERPGVLDDVGQRERIQLLAEAIAGLPERCRDVFILYKIEGLARKEAAARLGLSEKTVEAHTARAMRHCEAFFRRKGGGAFFTHE